MTRRRRDIRPEWSKNEGGRGKALLRFLGWHGEKFVAAALFIAAVWFALHVGNYQSLPWHSRELEQLVDDTEEIIKHNAVTLEDKELHVFDFAAYAEQIKTVIPTAPYRSETAWFPVLHPPLAPRGGFEILTATSLRAETVRRTGLASQERLATQRNRTPLLRGAEEDQSPENVVPVHRPASIWVNLYATIPFWEQWGIYNQVLDNIDPESRPEYVYYELERTEVKPREMPDWQAVAANTGTASEPRRLIPFAQQQEALQEANLLLFSDLDIEPDRTYAYRIRLYVRNPNYNLQDIFVEAEVDTTSEFVRSDWSPFARVYVPERTLVQLRSVTPTDGANFPRQGAPLRPIMGTLVLHYLDIEQGVSLPLVERAEVLRGMLGNMSQAEANRYISRGGTGEIIVNYPEAGLRSNVCVMDFSGGRRLQKRPTREGQASPDLFVPSRALLLLPDGTMQTTSAEPELFR